jgi:hypothetical protein
MLEVKSLEFGVGVKESDVRCPVFDIRWPMFVRSTIDVRRLMSNVKIMSRVFNDRRRWANKTTRAEVTKPTQVPVADKKRSP